MLVSLILIVSVVVSPVTDDAEISSTCNLPSNSLPFSYRLVITPQSLDTYKDSPVSISSKFLIISLES